MRRMAFLTSLAMLLLASLGAATAGAEEIEVRAARLRATEEGLVLDADFAFDLTPRLADVVANGVPLYFRVEFELTRHRWYWFDETTAARRLQMRLSYHALSRQYRLSTRAAAAELRHAGGSAQRAEARAQLAGRGALRLAAERRIRGGGAHAASTPRSCPSRFS